MASLADLLTGLNKQNFGAKDSQILSAIMHPVEAAKRFGNKFTRDVNTAAGLADLYDNPNPLYAPSEGQQAKAAFDLAGFMQTGACPFAPTGAGTLGTITKRKNLNAGLLAKYLQEGKLSPEEMAQYEANALKMETPNLQKYNVQNAEAQIPDTGKRARTLGFMTQPSKEQYHLSRNEWESNIPDLTKSDLGFHTGTLEQAESRGKAMAPSEYEYGIGQHIIPILQDKYANMLRLKDTGSFHADAIAPALEKKGILAKGMAKKIQNAVNDSWEMNEFFDPKMRDALKQQDIDAIKYANEQEGAGDSYAYINPSIIRSRFAAFDPLRQSSPSLLAGGLLGSLLLNQEAKKEQ